MDAILGEIGKALAGFFGSPVVQFVIYSIAVYLVVLWLASAYWVFRDMQQRTENAILPYLAASLVIVFLPVFPLAVFVYKIVRPHEKIGEVYERNLAEEALLAEVESIKSCPTCARRVNDEWIICPTCRTRLNRVCPNCSRLVGLDWSLCAWCGKDFERRPVAANLGQIPASQDAPGRIAAGESPMAAPAGSAAVRTSVRPTAPSSRGMAGRPGGGTRSTGPVPASAQDPLPER
jgi:RNA polymerase subunit RPABC4/transcription elongation factor Spt4